MVVKHRAVTALPTLMRALRKEAPPRNHAQLPSLRRAFSLYDQIKTINDVPEDQLRFQEYSDTGFTVNGVSYEGGVLCIGNLAMSWKPQKLSDITAESLSIFKTVRPVPEILVLGCGRYIHPVSPELRSFIRSTGMKVEAIDSRNAASTYNILVDEGRVVAAAIIPYGATS